MNEQAPRQMPRLRRRRYDPDQGAGRTLPRLLPAAPQVQRVRAEVPHVLGLHGDAQVRTGRRTAETKPGTDDVAVGVVKMAKESIHGKKTISA